MFTAKRSLFSSERGTTTSWLAGITAAALLVGTVALPAMATEEGTPEQTGVVEPAEVTTEEVVTTPEEEPAAEPDAVIDEPIEEVVEATEEAVIDEPIEDVADDATELGTEPVEQPAAQPEAPVASEVSQTEEPGTAASSTDGETADNNSPPVEENVVAVSENPTIVTDKADYPPGATVTITGEGWQGGEAVHIYVNDESSKSWSHNSDPDPVADNKGRFEYVFTLPLWFVSNYTAIATGQSSGKVAKVDFTDLSIGLYDQCENDDGDGYGGDPGACSWTNGNLGPGSTYFEGDSTVQRAWLTDFAPGSTHTLTLQYGTTKGGKHAYDFLTSWHWSEGWVTTADRCEGITGCTTAPETTSPVIPTDPNADGHDAALADEDRKFAVRGGTISAVSTPVIESGTYAGDSETIVVITFTVANSGPMCSDGLCDVALWFGAHVASQTDWGIDQGAGSISGSPYHVALYRIDGASIGQRDNQMQANAVAPDGKITIVKDAVPNDPQDFNFKLTNGTTITELFTLDDDGAEGSATPASQPFAVPPGNYTAEELVAGLPAAWKLTGITCRVVSDDVKSPTSTFSTNLAAATATITINSNDHIECTFTNTKGLKDLTVTKTADGTKTRTYKWLIDKSVDDTRVEIAEGGTATFNYTVKATPNGYIDSGWTLGGKITVANPNSESVVASVTDLLDKGGSCLVTGLTEAGTVSVPANDKVELNYTCTTDGTTTKNTATVTWDKDVYFTPNGSAAASADVSFTATEVNKSITVVDDKTDPANPVTLGNANWNEAGTPTEFKYALSKTGIAGKCTDYTNIAKITQTGQTDSEKVTVCVGKDLTVSKTAAGAYGREYLWTITKDVDKTEVKINDDQSATFNYTVKVEQTGIKDSNGTLSGVITVKNPNDWQAIEVTNITDTIVDGPTCDVSGTFPMSVPASGQVEVNYTCTFGATPVFSGTNQATATWDKAKSSTPNGSASGTKSFTLTQSSSVNKTIDVTDTMAGALGSVTAMDSQPWASKEFQYSKTFEGVGGTCTDYTNIAKITQTGQTDSEKVTVCVGKDLTVSKTAAGAYGREYLWTITKDVDKTEVKINDDQSATFNYTVKVEQTGIKDSNGTLSGVITVKNPNDWQAIEVTNITDTIVDGPTCDVSGTFPMSVPASGQVEVNYTCTFGATPVFSGTNQATATWDKAKSSTPNGSASGTKSFTLTQSSSVNKTIDVTDTMAGALGSVTAMDSQPWASKEFQYSKTFEGVGGTCTDYTNIAKITQTGQTDSEKVTVCVGKDLTVSKTAAGTFDRTYNWTIDKKVNEQESVSVLAGAPAEGSDTPTETFKYSVKVEQTGYTDSGWTASGVITVTNPNDWQDVTLSSLTDTVNNDGTCVVNPPAGEADAYVVPRSGTLEVSYTCTWQNEPESYEATNTATATWDKAVYFTPKDTATGTAGFTLIQAGSTNKEVEIVDTNVAAPLGTLEATDEAPFTEQSFPYELTFNAPAPGECVTYPNTASVLPAIEQENDGLVARILGLFGLADAAEAPVREALATDEANAELCRGTLDKAANPADGSAVEKGQIITYTIVVTNPSGEAVTGQTLVDNVPTDVLVDAGSIAPVGTWDATARTITWKFDLAAATETGPGTATFTYKATVDVGYTASPVTLVNTATWVERKLSDSTSHPVKALAADVIEYCIGDAPYYALNITAQNGKLFSSQTATVRWYQANEAGQPVRDANGNLVPAYNPNDPNKAPYVDTYTLVDGALSIKDLLWKGAAVDAQGNATAWPGWSQPSPGVWVQVDSGGVRPGMFAVIEVNPTAQTTAVYPPAAAPCANPPGVPQLDKTADPAEGTEVDAGQTIDYSVTVTNTGGSTFTGPMVDTLPDGFTVDATTISDSGTLSGNTITWTVSLAAGASKTFTYSGTVDLDAAGELLNVVVLTLADGGTVSDQTLHPVAVVEGIEEEVVAEIADTGANVGPLVTTALLALLAGGLMITFGRRRRNEG